MENFWPSRLFAVIIEHTPENCPLNQHLPNDALKLADNLEHTETRGAFSMRQHFGVDLVKTKSPKDLTGTYARLLPKHKPVFIVDVSDDERLMDIYARASQLDTDEKLRLALFDYVADHVDYLDLEKTVEQKLPTRSLKTLPEYLRENAPSLAVHSS